MTAAYGAIAWHAFRTILDQHQRFLLTSHVKPDCDALGSELAMAELLETFGKQVRIVNADRVPPRLAFVDPQRRIELLQEPGAAGDGEPVDVMMVLDTSAWGQLGRMADVVRKTPAHIVIVDHHVTTGEMPGTLFHDPTAEATGRLVADLVDFLDVPLTATMADALFTAIATDTGWFRFPSTTGSTYRVVARLLEAGASPAEIYRQLYERDSLSRTKLRSRVLDRMTLDVAGRLAHTYIAGRDFDETGAHRSDTEDFINMALAIDGTEVAVMLTEQRAGTVKISLRSRENVVDCSRVAALFGGGGHQAAAGATVDGELLAVRTRVLDAVRRVLHGEWP